MKNAPFLSKSGRPSNASDPCETEKPCALRSRKFPTQPSGIAARNCFGFAYGGGLPQMSVVEYQGVYMIKNGYHRAYALFERGHKSLPCILLRTDNYNATGAIGPAFFSIDVMMSDRSPLLSDFS